MIAKPKKCGKQRAMTDTWRHVEKHPGGECVWAAAFCLEGTC